VPGLPGITEKLPDYGFRCAEKPFTGYITNISKNSAVGIRLDIKFVKINKQIELKGTLILISS
jgi:hypothetical protein